MLDRRKPIRQVGVTAIASCLVFNEISGKSPSGVGDDRNHIARGVPPSNMHNSHFPSPQPNRNLIGESHRRPSQARNRFGGAKEARKATNLGVHVLLTTLSEQATCSI